MSDSNSQNQVPSGQQPVNPAQPSPQPTYRPSQMNAQPAAQPAQQPAYRQAPAAQPVTPQRPPQAQQSQQTYANPGYRQVTAQPAHSSTAAASSGTWVKSLVAGIIGALLATIITLAVSGIGGSAAPAGDATSPVASGGAGGNTTISVTGGDITLPEAVAAKTLPSVVCIYVYQEQTSLGWFGQESSGEQMSGLGSGVILTDDGYILTNYHVIEGESSLKVSVNNEQYDATVVGTDASSDLAVIKIDGADGLTPIEVGSSADLVVGEWVMTVGSPYGMEQSVGTGIVSAVSRSSASLQDTEGGAIYANMIQTDAPINPGNSGGALVDKDGKLVGINTLAASYSGSNAGVGFAIPSDYAISIANQIMNGEEPSHAQMGVSLVNVDAATAQRYNLAVSEGAYVAATYAGAAEAGIEEGDIITKVNGKKVTSATDVILQVRSSKVGDTIPVEVNRKGETKTMDVTLTSDAESSTASSENGKRRGGE